MSTFRADLIQYMRPDGRPKDIMCQLPIDSESAYQVMLSKGYRLEAEVLMTGEVSVTIFDPASEEDIEISVTPNGPQVQTGMVAMLERFLTAG